MVYTGKPSTGCERCRQRRKKCDETRPHCLNCRRLGRTCPGFPDAIDLMFRNETISSSRRAYGKSPPSKRRRRPSKPVSEPKPDCERIDPELGAQRSFSVVERPVTDSPTIYSNESDAGPFSSSDSTQPISTNAWAFVPTFAPISTPEDFFSQPEEQMFEFVPSDYSSQFSTVGEELNQFTFETALLAPRASRRWDGVLYNTTEAVALRTLSILPGHEQLSGRAEAKLRCIKTQLQALVDDDDRVANDSELLALSLTTLDEATTLAERSGDWTQMLAIEVRKRTTGSPHSWFPDLADAPKTALLEHATRLPVMLDRAKQLLQYRPCTAELILDVNALIDSAYRLQRDLFSLDLNMSAEYDFQNLTSPTEDQLDDEAQIHSDRWRGAFHKYKSFETSSVRNIVRACQLLCCELLTDALKWLSPLLYDEEPRYKATIYRMQYLLNDIAASVPYHMGYDFQDDVQAGASPGTQSAATTISPAVISDSKTRIEAMHAVVWTLHVAARVQHTPELQRRWFRARLKAIAQACEENRENKQLEG